MGGTLDLLFASIQALSCNRNISLYMLVCMFTNVHETFSEALRHEMFCAPTVHNFMRLFVLSVQKGVIETDGFCTEGPLGLLAADFRDGSFFLWSDYSQVFVGRKEHINTTLKLAVFYTDWI